MIPAKYLCRKHLLGEHNELHKHLPSLRKGHNIKGRFFPVVQIELASIESRHDELTKEMTRRGYNHNSPLTNIPDLKKIYPQWFDLKVDLEYNLIDLGNRCLGCCENLSIREKKL